MAGVKVNGSKLDDNIFVDAGTSLTGGISITSDSGVVETIKTADGFQMTSTDIDVLKANVASWLTTNNFDDVETALANGTEQQVNDLMAVFEQTNWQLAM